MDTGFEGWHLYTACKLTFTHLYQENDYRYERFGTDFWVQFPPGDPRFEPRSRCRLRTSPHAFSESSGRTQIGVVGATHGLPHFLGQPQSLSTAASPPAGGTLSSKPSALIGQS
jgi:hypothetical protein